MREPFVLIVLLLVGCGEPPSTPPIDPPGESDSAKPDASKADPPRIPVAIRRAGFHAHDDLPDHPADLHARIVPEIVFEEVQVFDRLLQPPLLGTWVEGRIVHRSRNSLSQVRLHLIRYSPAPNGGWIGERAAPVVVPVVPGHKAITFRMRSPWIKRNMERFVLVATAEPEEAKWVKLAECAENDLTLEVQGGGPLGKDRLLIKGFVENKGPSVVAEYKVQVDLYDLRNSFLGTVQAKWSHDGVGEPFVPGTRRNFEVRTDDFQQADIGSGTLRAIGRIR